MRTSWSGSRRRGPDIKRASTQSYVHTKTKLPNPGVRAGAGRFCFNQSALASRRSTLALGAVHKRRQSMRSFFILGFAALAATANSATSAELSDLAMRVDAVNSSSVRSFGVSLGALLYLRNASDSSLLNKTFLESSGDIDLIRELETRGFVATRTVMARPDGAALETFVQVTAVGEGVELQRALVQRGRAHKPSGSK